MFDQGNEEDRPDTGPLLPPDDRLWRHPSEMRAAAAPPTNGPGGGSGPPQPGGEHDGRRFPWALSLVSAVAGATAALGVVLIAGGLSGSDLERPVAQPIGDQTPQVVPASVRPGGVAQIAAAFEPALVRIELPGEQTASGVVFRDDGLLLTTAHGLDDAESVTVVLADGTRADGTVVGTDEWTDLAVVDVAHDSQAATMGSSSQVVVGDAALVVTAPLASGTSPTVTVGVVSALEQAIASESRTLRGLIRADAGVASSASGGALLDEAGHLVGIITVPEGAESSGYGYAVPVDLAREVATDLVEEGRASHVWLGIEGVDAQGAGVVVERVAPASPAADAGIDPADLIVAVAGERVGSMADLVAELREHEPGDDVSLEYRRGDDTTTTEVTLAERS